MKTSVILSAALFMLSLCSCHKDWVCSCTDQSGNYSSKEIDNETLLNARAKCKSMNYDYYVLGVHASQDCSLGSQVAR